MKSTDWNQRVKDFLDSAGMNVPELCRELKIPDKTIYRWLELKDRPNSKQARDFEKQHLGSDAQDTKQSELGLAKPPSSSVQTSQPAMLTGSRESSPEVRVPMSAWSEMLNAIKELVKVEKENGKKLDLVIKQTSPKKK